MRDPTNKADADRKRGSLKEAIGKIIGDNSSIAEGAAERDAIERPKSKPA
jgi:uncharacterized protein YjbJ (UPF0337 family)